MEIELPDGTILDAPDDADIKAVVQGYNKSIAPKPPKSAATLAAQAAVQNAMAQRLGAQDQPPSPRLAAGAPDMLGDAGASFLSSLVAGPVSGLAGLGTAAGNVMGLTDANPSDVIDSVGRSMTYQPRTAEGQLLTKSLNYPFQKLGEGADWAGSRVAENTGSPALGALVNTGIQSVPAILGGRGTRTVSRGLESGEAAPRGAPKISSRKAGLADVPPTIEELGKQSSAAYKRAKDAGADIAPESFDGLKSRIGLMAKEEGINPKLHPDAAAALDEIAGTEGAVSLQQLETLRKIANDAKGSQKPADARIAGKIVDEIDDYMEGVGQKDLVSGTPEGFAALKEARGLYSRKMKAEEIHELFRRAELSAPNFSASGMENALRIEFKNLAKNKKRMRRFNAEEQAAIEKVAKGGPLENTLRMLGKFAPTGFLSGVAGVAATAAGLPIIPIGGIAARYGATRMTRANAVAAEELMRRGNQPTRKTPTFSSQPETVD